MKIFICGLKFTLLFQIIGKIGKLELFTQDGQPLIFLIFQQFSDYQADNILKKKLCHTQDLHVINIIQIFICGLKLTLLSQIIGKSDMFELFTQDVVRLSRQKEC
jgi:hypothetical protein